jgi:hypothetical protein
VTSGMSRRQLAPRSRGYSTSTVVGLRTWWPTFGLRLQPDEPDRSEIVRRSRLLMVAPAMGLVAAVLAASCTQPAPSSRLDGSPSAGMRGWRSIAVAPIPGRTDFGVVWTGQQMIVWGGLEDAGRGDSRASASGAMYTPANDSWTELGWSVLSARTGPQIVTLGAEVLVWGGVDPATSERLADGATYDPRDDLWTEIAPPEELQGATVSTLVGTGDAAYLLSPNAKRAAQRFDEIQRTWQPIADPPALPPVDLATAAWTGDKVVWILYPSEGPNAFVLTYDVKRDEWSSDANPPPLPATLGAPGIWNGKEVLVIGSVAQAPRVPAAAFDPTAHSWRSLSGTSDCTTTSAVWTGRELLSAEHLVEYDPAASVCEPIQGRRPGDAREGSTPVWTGVEMLLWSGMDGRLGSPPSAGGVAYRP